ncbi:type II toxin-antitoxin system VapC family toxin [Silvibacterium dinghuense]|nr:type II toxin-antitoxin system VapC family toxin [Silvibacterium dinghuense]GGH01209.1 twitching motility protein PilT [Silvibacterium dinghuense]
MYLLDTNVVSELRKAATPRIDRHVRAWAKQADRGRLYLSVISILELEIGIRQLERRDREQAAVLRHWLEQHVLTAFAGRILPVDLAVAQRCAALHVPDPSSERDALIAATALVHGMTIVTRHEEDFRRTGVVMLNPWHSLPPG